MLQLLLKYLTLHQQITIPGIGIFNVERQRARLDFANKIFSAPDVDIHFKAASLVDDNRFYTFIAKEKKIDITQAAVLYNDFINELKENLSRQKIIVLPEMGVLSQNDDGKLSFTSSVKLKDYFPDAAADRILREHVEHTVLVGDKNRTNTEMKEIIAEDIDNISPAEDNWWIFAIALAIIGIATIVYYYLHNGSLR